MTDAKDTPSANFKNIKAANKEIDKLRAEILIRISGDAKNVAWYRSNEAYLNKKIGALESELKSAKISSSTSNRVIESLMTKNEDLKRRIQRYEGWMNCKLKKSAMHNYVTPSERDVDENPSVLL